MQTFSAPAKLNLFLHVVGRRPDGYHLLQTVFRLLDFHDQIDLEVREDGVIRLITPLENVPVEQDLCIRAASLLQSESGTHLGVDIAVQKRIPMGGGLGGGSSDAATMLMALNELWCLNWESSRLQALGLKLGADVPVFIFGENAFAEGIGEQLTALSLPQAWYLVIVPPVHVSTVEIFSNKELTRNTIPITIPPFSIWDGHNDLEPVVCSLFPEVSRSLEWLKRLENTKITAMSGSGACVFSEFATESDANAAFATLPEDMRGFVARGLERHPMRKIMK